MGVKGVPRGVVSEPVEMYLTLLHGSEGCSQGCSLRACGDISGSYMGVRDVSRGVVSEPVEICLTLLHGSEGCSQGCSLRAYEDVSDSLTWE